MFDSKKNIKNNSLNIFFDIRNSSVGIAFWEYINGTPTIIYTDRQYILFEEKQKSDNFVDNIYKTLDQVIGRISKLDITKKNKLKNIGQVSCFLSYPWYKAEIKNIKIKEKKRKRFSDDYLNKKIKLLFENQKDKNYQIIEDKILSVYLNGYEVANPKNKEFEDIQISAYRSIISKNTKEEIEEKIKNNFKCKEISFYTHPFSIISVLRSNFHALDNFSLFDIGGEITELLNFKNGSLSGMKVVPNGFNFLIRELSTNINENKNSTFSKIKLLTENELQDEKLKAQIINISNKWFENLNDTNDNKGFKTQQNIFITADKDFSNVIKNIFNTKDFYYNSLDLEKEPVVRIVNSENTRELATYLKDVEKDPLLSILFNFQQLILRKI